jgi:hypothetical protein
MKRFTIVMVMIALMTSTALAQSSTAEDRCFERGGNWDAATSQCQIQAGISIQINYPLELTDYDFARASIDTFLAETQSDMVAWFSEIDFSQPLSSYANSWSLDIDYALHDFSDTVISVVFYFSTYTGGAHPNHDFKTFTFDLSARRELTLDDVLRTDVAVWPTLSAVTQANLTEQLGEFADAAWISEGTGENPDNYRNWALDAENLYLFFPPYQVAAYAAGSFMVAIPLDSIGTLLQDRFRP